MTLEHAEGDFIAEISGAASAQDGRSSTMNFQLPKALQRIDPVS